MKVREQFILISTILLSGIGLISLVWPPILWTLIVVLPIVLLGIYDLIQKPHSILRNFPVVGHFRFLLEKFRPEIMQYFVETDTDGRPLNRIQRSMVYQRAKGVTDTTPFGTQENVYSEGYEWMEHSIYAKDATDIEAHPRVLVGNSNCKQPYSASVLNISAMSYGSLSKNAVLALNGGAKKGGFAHNTGEGGLSPYHLQPGGDLIWQIGTGYFGCRTENGDFLPELFEEHVHHPSVKMIEIKLSQGAKPGHGGILPSIKNTEEIAAIRKVKPHTTVYSPTHHTAFSDAEGLLNFIQQLKDLSGGKPVGFKLCVGRHQEFVDICKAMIKTGIQPDFITVDGGEGGTGAAPVEFSNSLGMPLRDGLAFVCDTLIGFDLKKDITVIASGKIISGFDMVRAIALGADMCNMARGMMLATGCIQSLECHLNTCPVGVATQNESLMKGLVVEDKVPRVANYHSKTVHSFVELVAAAGFSDHREIAREHIYRRINMDKVLSYEQIYPQTEVGSLRKREMA
ncbi:MAG: FMN-binding glutamate synthase family protein [Flavobacteriales bacterium]|nr:FMN-binding glutamate synthase family protein [Flavobacteriales bacterium]